MKWKMEAEEVEVALEKVNDLHDKVSDAIHGISRAHFLNSIKTTLGNSKTSLAPANNDSYPHQNNNDIGEDGGRTGGFVFVKELGVYVDHQAIAEARSLNGIRTALENLEYQLEFFHTVQAHQQAERDAAVARLEQSRVFLAIRLADYHGKMYNVIEEAIAFVGDVHAGSFGAEENISGKARSQSSDNFEGNNGKIPNNLLQILMSGISLAKRSLRFDGFGGIIGNAAVFAVSVIAMTRLHQMTITGKKIRRSNSRLQNYPEDGQVNRLDVLLARG